MGDKKEVVKDSKTAKRETKRPTDEPKTGDKLPKMAEKKQSKSPRRRAEAYQRPASTSSEEGDHSHSHPKRSHKARGVAKKQAEKGGSSILKFSEAADVVNAAIKIQGAYRGYRARVEIREHHDSIDVPDDPPVEPKKKQESMTPKRKGKTTTSKRAAWADVVSAVITIQRAYRKYRRNQILHEMGHDSDCDGAEAAVVKIQAHFKGFQARKMLSESKPSDRGKKDVAREVQPASSKTRKEKAIPPGPVQKHQTQRGKENKGRSTAMIMPKKRPIRTETYV